MSKDALFEIACWPWGGEYRPKAYAKMQEIPGGIEIRLWCEEVFAPPACTEDGGPVYLDSCLEAFMAFYPEAGDAYINFEMNAAGALLMQFGPERAGRCALEKTNDGPFVTPFSDDASWGVRLDVPYAFIQKVYGMPAPPRIERIRGNFYKCGAVAGREHYACWAPIQTPAPDFHRPEFFQPLCPVTR